LPGRRRVAVPPAQQALRAHLGDDHHQPELLGMGQRVRRPENDYRAARPVHASLPYRRNRQRQLPLQEQFHPGPKEVPQIWQTAATLSHTLAPRPGSIFNANPGSVFGAIQHSSFLVFRMTAKNVNGSISASGTLSAARLSDRPAETPLACKTWIKYSCRPSNSRSLVASSLKNGT